jgi:enoyl-CoA hydratase/carnithine racemase
MTTTAQDTPKENPEDILLRHDDDGVATLTLNRPSQYNGLSEAMLDALDAQIDAISNDRSVRVVVIAANGKAFCAGHDLKEMRATPELAYYQNLFQRCSKFMLSLLALPQPVVARVHGVATAAGCQLVATCDLAVASEEAMFGTSGINVGLFCMTPGVGISRNMKRKDAFEMLFTGDLVSAETAQDFGLINKVVPATDLDAVVQHYTDKIKGKSAAAVAAGKQAYYRQLEMGISDAYAFAGEEMARNMMFHDAGEGIDAFIEKRPPNWKHE